MSFFDRALGRERPPGPGTAEETAALAAAHPWPWSLEIDHAAYAKHPDTPLDWLLVLAERIPEVVLKNTALRMHLALSPVRFQRASILCQAQLIGHWGTSPELIRLLAGTQSADVNLRVIAASNPRCPEDLLWDYLGHSKHVRAAILDNPRAPRRLVREVSRVESKQRMLGARYRQAHTAPPVPRPAPPLRPDSEDDALLSECPFTLAGPVAWSERWRRRSIHRRRRSL